MELFCEQHRRVNGIVEGAQLGKHLGFKTGALATAFDENESAARGEHALQEGVLTIARLLELRPSDLVEGVIDVLDDVEAVDGDVSVGAHSLGARDKGIVHVDAKFIDAASLLVG